MPQIDVFMAEFDVEKIVSTLLDAGSVLVPDFTSDQPIAQEIRSLNTFQEWRSEQQASFFFATSREWTVAPFEWGQFKKHDQTRFFIRQKIGGPTLDIFAPSLVQHGLNKVAIPHGFIAYHSTFWNTVSLKNEKPNDALKLMYKQLKDKLRCDAKEIVGTNRKYLITSAATKLLDNGAVLGPPFDKEAKAD